MKAKTVFERVRRSGVRIHGGPWTVSGIADAQGRLVVALGRAAGPAVVRSRVRRIARDVFLRDRGGLVLNTSVLVRARASLAEEPRQQMRASLAELKVRLDQAMNRQKRGDGDRVAG
jgi:ribonuclease P protein component